MGLNRAEGEFNKYWAPKDNPTPTKKYKKQLVNKEKVEQKLNKREINSGDYIEEGTGDGIMKPTKGQIMGPEDPL